MRKILNTNSQGHRFIFRDIMLSPFIIDCKIGNNQIGRNYFQCWKGYGLRFKIHPGKFFQMKIKVSISGFYFKFCIDCKLNLQRVSHIQDRDHGNGIDLQRWRHCAIFWFEPGFQFPGRTATIIDNFKDCPAILPAVKHAIPGIFHEFFLDECKMWWWKDITTHGWRFWTFVSILINAGDLITVFGIKIKSLMFVIVTFCFR